MKMYFIQANSHDGDSLDLFVVAVDDATAVKRWQEYFARDDTSEIERIWLPPAAAAEMMQTSDALVWGVDVIEVPKP